MQTPLPQPVDFIEFSENDSLDPDWKTRRSLQIQGPLAKYPLISMAPIGVYTYVIRIIDVRMEATRSSINNSKRITPSVILRVGDYFCKTRPAVNGLWIWNDTYRIRAYDHQALFCELWDVGLLLPDRKMCEGKLMFSELDRVENNQFLRIALYKKDKHVANLLIELSRSQFSGTHTHSLDLRFIYSVLEGIPMRRNMHHQDVYIDQYTLIGLSLEYQPLGLYMPGFFSYFPQWTLILCRLLLFAYRLR
eukprot:TRINITY_DN9866_c0_g1_i5.p1 TRINITY_DN9866_c0_g1~~TRINITY_DN9866_c0_g1_i5.p1  ORF type:complete len:249 (+),score=-4.64 TRINITY_DN9866_c0_g1_i5:383-1129(+)